MNVHFMAVPADRMIAVDIPVAVYKILHVTVVLLTTIIRKSKCSRVSK